MFDFLLNTKKRYCFLVLAFVYIFGIIINLKFKIVVGGFYVISILIANVIFGVRSNIVLLPANAILSVIGDLGRQMPIHSFYTKQVVFGITTLFAVYTGLEIRKYVNLLIKRKQEVVRVNQDLVLAFINTIEAKDGYLCGHSLSVSYYAKLICQQMGYSEKECKKIYLAGVFHDIGKIGVCETVLNKPGKLNDEEWIKIKKHPVIGAEIVSKIEALKEVSDIIKYHHVYYNGKGYPSGLDGDQIPIGARIIAVADSFDAMISDRPYRKAMSVDEACRELERYSGTQFDPFVVKAFIECVVSTKPKHEMIFDKSYELLNKMYS